MGVHEASVVLKHEAFFGGRVLKPTALAEAPTPVTLNDGSSPMRLGRGYGYGWAVLRTRGLTQVFHAGG